MELKIQKNVVCGVISNVKRKLVKHLVIRGFLCLKENFNYTKWLGLYGTFHSCDMLFIFPEVFERYLLGVQIVSLSGTGWLVGWSVNK